MHYCIPRPSLEINSVTATAKIAEVTRYAIGSLKNSNRHAESITIANLKRLLGFGKDEGNHSWDKGLPEVTNGRPDFRCSCSGSHR